MDSSLLISKPAIDGLPDRKPRLLYLRDFDTFDSVPEYKKLNRNAKNKLAFNALGVALYKTYLGRLYFNINHWFSLYLMRYLPYLAFFRFGVKQSYVSPFVEDPTDDTKPRPNSDFYKDKVSEPWYKEWLSYLW